MMRRSFDRVGPAPRGSSPRVEAPSGYRASFAAFDLRSPVPVLVVPATALSRVSARRGDALLHAAGTTLWARRGAVASLGHRMTQLALLLAGSRGRTATWLEIAGALFDEADGGVVDPANSVTKARSGTKAARRALGVELHAIHGIGLRLSVGDPAQ